MPTPPKPIVVLETEKKSHRTKAEKEQRRKAEEALLTGQAMREKPQVKKNDTAHKEFLRIKKLLEKIDKNDDLNANVINRYCLLYAECIDFEEKREAFYRRAEELEGRSDIDLDMNYYKTLATLQSQVISIDKQIQAKRKMMLDIEKECLMTVAAALRSIPKKPAEEEEDPMQQLLQRRAQR